MNIVMMPIEHLSPAEYNPRGISPEALDGLRASLREFGMPQPIVANHRSDGRKVIIGGHQRFEAAKLEEWTEVPVILVQVSVAKEKAMNVSLNNKSIEGFFTADLQELLKDIAIDIPEDLFAELRLDTLINTDWSTDFDPNKDLPDGDPLKKSTIFIDCPPDLKDEVLIYIKAKLLETSFEGVHVR